MKRDLASVVESLGDFIGYKVPPNALSGLLSHMHIDNFRKNDAVNMKPPPGLIKIIFTTDFELSIENSEVFHPFLKFFLWL